MRLEGHPALGNFAQRRQRHYLKPARIGENRFIPAHELMQSTKPRNPLGTGAQHQVIGIAEQNIRARRRHLFGQHAFHRRRRAHGHKRGCADSAMRGVDHPGAGMLVGRMDSKLNGHTGAGMQESDAFGK